MEPVQIERTNGVAIVRIADGGANYFGRTLAESLRKSALKLQDSPPEAVVVVGTPDFCGGLAEPTDPLFEPFRQLVANRDAFRAQEIVQRYCNALAGLSRLPCVVVSAIEGRCHGPGLALALAADVRVAAVGSTFAPTPLARGVVPGFGELAMLGLRAGIGRITPAILTGQTWDAADALSLGLVNRLVPDGEAEATAMNLVTDMLAQPPATRVQALVTLRAMAAEAARDAESQAGARTWVRGEWQA